MKYGDYFKSDILKKLSKEERTGLLQYFKLVGIHIRSWKKTSVLLGDMAATYQYVDDRNILMGDAGGVFMVGKEYSLDDLKKLINLASFE